MNPPPRLHATAAPDERQARRDRSEDPEVRFRVLVADDQPEHLEMIARAIEHSPLASRIDLVRAVDGSEAWDRVQEGIDLAFLDIRMPGCSGLQLAERVRQVPTLATLPIVIVSSSSDPRDVQTATALRVAAYVEKGRFGPFRERIEGVLSAFINGKPL